MTIGKYAICMVVFAALALLAGQSEGRAASAGELNAGARATLDHMYRTIPGTRELGARAAGILVFPNIVKAGFGVGGEYGEGVMRIRGRTVGYYNSVAASVGFQVGAQARSVVIMFMTPGALESFQYVDGWKVGVDGSIAIINVGAGGSVDSSRVATPVVGFIFDNRGLMYNLTLEGSKISRIYR